MSMALIHIHYKNFDHDVDLGNVEEIVQVGRTVSYYLCLVFSVLITTIEPISLIVAVIR